MKQALILILLLSSSAFAARIPLAVYEVEPQGVNPATATIVTDIVRSKLRGCGRFDLIEKAKMEEVLRLQGFQQTGCTEIECAAKLGKILNVKKMVVGGLGKLGGSYRLSLRVVDVETAVIEAEDEEKQVLKEDDLDKLVPPLVTRLCPKIKVSGTTVAPPSGGGTEVSTGSLTVNSTPSGATVFLDGEPKGLTPQGLTDVPAGEHQLVLTLEGYKDYQKTVTTIKGAKELVSAVLTMQVGSLRITTSPSGANVFVDGVNRGVSTESGLLISGLRVGEHQLKATKVRFEPYESSVFVEPDVTKDVKVDISAKPGSVVVTSTPSGASVYLNGASKGVTPCSVSDLAPGTYSVSLKKDGYEEHSGSVSVSAGKSETYSAVLRKVVVEAPTPPQPSPAGGGSKDVSAMILIPAGEFTMGSNEIGDEKPIHTVYLDAYYIDKYEVTVGQFRKFCSATGRAMPDQLSWNQEDNNPVVNVSWEDASAYASWAGKRLPTEAEWEKAARGTDGRKYPWGNTWDASKCNNGESNSPDGYAKTAPVGSFPQGASPYGVMDMAGNVFEWCADWYEKYYYQISPNRNPTGPSSGSNRVLRGGSWLDYQINCRSASRHYSGYPQIRYGDDGFRCVR